MRKLALVLWLCGAVWPALAGGWYGVNNVDAVPHRAVGKIVAFWPGGRITQGTGAMISDSHVVTAAHVLWDFDRKVGPVTVMFTPAERYGRAPLGSANAARWAVASNFQNGRNRNQDFGIIKLNRRLTKVGRYFKLATWDRAHGYNCTIAGYTPSWSGGNWPLYGTSHLSSSWRDSAYTWSADEYLQPLGGLSGSPAWFVSGSDYKLVGIYTRGGPFGIYGTKITQPVRNAIENWVRRNP